MFVWWHIVGVSESTFYHFKGYDAREEQAQLHGNIGM